MATVNAPPHDHARLLSLGRSVLEIESRAISDLAKEIDHTFAEAAEIMLGCRGRIVVLGMGKSGHIGSKIAATLASTGSPAFFVHPGEASHGDMGMITVDDVVLALSNSGETDEIVILIPLIRRLGVPLVAMTGNGNSNLAKQATVHIDVGVKEEACPLGLAPTSSTTRPWGASRSRASHCDVAGAWIYRRRFRTFPPGRRAWATLASKNQRTNPHGSRNACCDARNECCRSIS